eukprot:1982772-Rhodomonas_salina.1
MVPTYAGSVLHKGTNVPGLSTTHRIALVYHHTLAQYPTPLLTSSTAYDLVAAYAQSVPGIATTPPRPYYRVAAYATSAPRRELVHPEINSKKPPFQYNLYQEC